MATLEECTSALERLSDQLGAVDPETRSRHVLNRTLACTVTDLGVTFRAELDGDGLHDLRTAEGPRADVRIKLSSDDLVALTSGQLNFGIAWATGRVKVDASITDLLRLRTLL